MKKRIIALFIALAAVMLPACSGNRSGGGTGSGDGIEKAQVSADVGNMDFDFTDRDRDGSYDEPEATKITLSDSGSTVSGSGASADGRNVTVSSAGTYIVTGTLSDGRITISAGEKDKVQLVLRNVSLTCGDGPALVIGSADKVFLTLDKDSENTISDGETRGEDDTKADGAVYSKADLTLNGSGSLTVSGNYKHGIVSKDDLVITGGVINVKSVKAGLCGKDCVRISGGDITVDAGSDAIRSDNEDNAAKGYVYICGGRFDLTAGSDGIQAVTLLEIAGGEINIVSGGGSGNTKSGGNNGFTPGDGNNPPEIPGGAAGGDADSPPQMPDGFDPGDGNGKPGGNPPSGSNGGRPGGNGGFPGGRPGDDSGKTDTDEESAKGLKSDSVLTISGGRITVDSKDDAVHSNGSISVTGGTLTAASGDDGIHADKSLSVSGGDIVITGSCEGLESAGIAISGGNISVTSSDDGINASDGSGNSITGAAQDVSLVISGGYIFIDAGGDGIDSNAAITVTGGVTLISGPTSDGDSAIDYETGATVTGGILIAAGSSGMAEGFTSADGQGAMLVNIASQSAGTPLVLCGSDGKAIVSFTPKKQYSSVVITVPGISSGNTYTLITGASVTGGDSNGYAMSPGYSGGTAAATIKMTSDIYGTGKGIGFRPGRR